MNASNNERVTINCGSFQRMFYFCRIAYVLLVGFVDAYENTPTYGLVSVSYYDSRCGKLPCVDRVYQFSGKKHLTQSLHYLRAVRQRRRVALAADCLPDCLKINSHEYSFLFMANRQSFGFPSTRRSTGDRCCNVAVTMMFKYLCGCNAGSGWQVPMEADVLLF